MPPELLGDERICEGEQHGDTNTDQERSVDQTSQQEHLGLQCVHQLWLTCRCLEVFTAHDSDTDTSTDCTQTDNQTASQRNKREIRHDKVPSKLKLIEYKRQIKNKNHKTCYYRCGGCS